MMSALLIAGIVAIVAGLGAVAYGIPVKEFSFGNTMIFVGAMAACTGLVMIGLAMLLAELKNIARRLPARQPVEPRARPGLPPPDALPARTAPAEGGFLFPRDEPVVLERDPVEAAAPPVSPLPPVTPLPWQEEAPRERTRPQLTPVAETDAEAAPPLPPKSPRNPLFSSRRERERVPLRATEPAAAEPRGMPAAEPVQAPPSPFDDAWPRPERAPLRRAGRSPVSFNETAIADQPGVTVVKSGVVDGMAYSLFSDGSIEAQMPEGMMRFGSIEELRAHLDQRP